MLPGYDVYHAEIGEHKRMAFGVEDAKNFPNEYVLVAHVKADDLDDAYMLTNSIHAYWWENPLVEAKKINTRSTSVGDVLVDKETGKKYAVDSFGFKEI